MASKLLNPHLFSADVEYIATRDGFGEGLLEAGEADERIVALVADLSESTRMEAFAKRFPTRFFDVGVAEQNLVTVASGLAATGKLPFAASYATFSPGRNWEQIRTTICYNDQPVKIIGSHAGVSVGPDGATHQALEDIAIMRALPNMTVIVPADSIQARKATLAIAELSSPAYLRLGREKSPVITTEQTPFTIGKALLLQAGSDVTIVATGPLLHEALVAATTLRTKGIGAEVLNYHTIKPFDEAALLSSVKKTGAVVTVEEHQVTGGLGGAVAEILARTMPTPIEFIGVADRFGESGEPAELLTKYGLRASNIVRAAQQVVKRKH